MQAVNIVYAVITIIAVLFLLSRYSRAHYAKGVRMAALWLAILALVFAGVVYWGDFKNTKFYNSLVSGSAAMKSDGSLEFSRGSDGHFHIYAKVNGQSVEFMVDTGASDIVLTKSDAKKLGFYPSELRFTKIYSTANGLSRGASVKLRNLEIGSYQTGEIYASVNEGELDTSLLGMSFLNKMKSYKIEGDKLIIQP